MYQKLRIKMNALSQTRWFYEIYGTIMCLITMIGWTFSLTVGMSILFLFTLFFFSLTFELKYPLLAFLFLTFMKREEWKLDDPIALIPVILISSCLIIMFGVGVIKSKKIPITKTAVVLLALGISTVLPIAWVTLITKEISALYFLYFNYFLYFIIYLLSLMSTKSKQDRDFLGVGLTYIAVLLSFQCFYAVSQVTTPGPDGIWYSLGWGICNEAAIMMLVIFPFLLIDVKRTKGWMGLAVIKVLILLLGLFFTFSRGAYLFGIVEIGLFVCYCIWKYRKRLLKPIIIVPTVTILVVLFLFAIHYNVISLTFKHGLSDTGRFALYQNAWTQFTRTWYTVIFGSGMVSEIDGLNRVVVYHSTLMQGLVSTGLIGTIFLFVLIGLKYYYLTKLKPSAKTWLIFIAYVVVDLYGLLDNTYQMYYYMHVIVVIMAMIETESKTEKHEALISSN